jgi:bile acid:Na+ symporter, BASS family
MEALEVFTNTFLYLFIISTMVSIGLGLSLRQIKNVLSNYGLIARGLIVNLLLVPIIAWIMTKIIPMDEVIALGFLVASISAGAPFGPKLAQIAKSDMPFAFIMMFVLSVLTVIATPLWLSVFLGPSSLNNASINPLPFLGQILVIYILPLIIGLFVSSKYSTNAQKYRPVALKVSNLSFPIVIVAIIATNVSGFQSLIGSLGIITSIISVVVYAMLGYIFGGPQIATKRSLAFDSAVRNGGLGLLLSAQVFSNEPKVGIMVATFGIIETVIMGMIGVLWSKRRASDAGENIQQPTTEK